MVKVGKRKGQQYGMEAKRELEELISQLSDGGPVGDVTNKSPEVDDIVNASGKTIRTIAAPEVALGVEPQAGGVVVVEGAKADEGVGASGL